MILFRRRVSNWRQNKQWTSRRLPLEIITRVLFYVVADALTKREVFGELPFLKTFPDLYHLILVIRDVPSTTSLKPQDYIRRKNKERKKEMKKFLKGMKCVTLQDYARLPQIYGRTPIKIFVASHDMLSRPTTTTLDRSRCSLSSRFLKPNSFVILPLNSGMMEFYAASGAWCFEMAGLEPWEDHSEVFEVDAPINRDESCFGTNPAVLIKCQQTPQVRVHRTLKRLDVVMSSGDEDHTVQPWLSIAQDYPSELLRVRFTSFLVPLLTLPFQVDDGDQGREGKTPKHRKLVLENLNWTEETPYGVCVQEGEEDQWEWNVGGLDERWGESPFKPFRQVILVGIPDFLVAPFEWRNVVSFHWGRLSAHEPIQQEECLRGNYLPLTLSLPKLQRLSIISARRRKEYFPQFEAPRLRKLELLSLMDSNTPWDVGDVLTGDSRELIDVYMEHRGKPDISLTPEYLDPVAPSIQKLHIRGYLPALGGPSITRFVKLRTMMLDVSHTSSTTLSILEDPISSPGKATIVLPQITYPALQSLTLMCTGPEILTNTHMELTIPRTVRLLQVSTSVNHLSITVNKIPLSAPPELKQEDIPVVQSRLCNQYRSTSLLSRRKFIYFKRVVINDNWLQEYREY